MGKTSPRALMSTTVKRLRYLFVYMNIVFVVFGLCLTGFGSYGIYVGTENNYDVITGKEFIAGSSILVAAGAFMIILAVFGIIGAIIMKKLPLIIYAVGLAPIVVAEIAAGVMGFAFRDSFNNEVEEAVTLAFQNNNTNDDTNSAVAFIQKNLECCGVFGPEDWLTLNPTVFNESGLRPPDECICIPEIDDHCEMVMQHIPADAIAGITRNQTTQYNAWNRGCLQLVQHSIDNLAIAIGGIGIGIGTIETTAILMDIGLLVHIYKKKNTTAIPMDIGLLVHIYKKKKDT